MPRGRIFLTTMIISFVSKELRDNAINEFLGMQNFPKQSLDQLKTVLTSFRVASTLKELPFFFKKHLNYTKENKVLLGVDGLVLHFGIAHETPPCAEDDTIDWDQVSRLQLIYIGDQNADE